MKFFLRGAVLLSLIPVWFNGIAQVTQLSDNTNLETAIPFGNFAILVSRSDSLWRTDGTVQGTYKYATNVSTATQFSYAEFLNKIYFSGNNTNGVELWSTDGTEVGTQLVKDINPNAASGSPQHLIVFNNVLYFFADNGVNGSELWKSDGTGNGTVLVKDINPGPGSSLANAPHYFSIGNSLYFAATNGTSGVELWKTDGTESGTVLVKDINPGPGSSNPTDFFAFGSIFLFTATDGMTGVELWKTDGTTAGTALVKDIATGFFGSNPFGFTVFKNKVYFDAFDLVNGMEGWVTDGTTANTTLLKNINPGFENGFPFFVNALFLNSKMYFPATSTAEGSEVWWSDGTGPNTTLFKDINTGSEGSDALFLLNGFNITAFDEFHTKLLNGVMFLNATTPAGGQELWKTDGSDAGTVMVKDINPGTASAIGNNFTYFYTPTHLYIAATDGLKGNELWKSDGTAAGTSLVFDINPGGDADPEFLTYFNGIYLFTAHDGDNATGLRDLFRLDGTFLPMPLTLVRLNAAVAGRSVQLKWTTVSEVNTARFDIEKSTDGQAFETAGTVKAANNSTDRKDYFFDDDQAFKNGTAILYYRLKILDNDGRFTCSKTIAVRNAGLEKLLAYPNPVNRSLTVVVRSERKERAVLSVFDAGGRQVYSATVDAVEGANSYDIDVSAFSKGVYTLRCATGNGTETVRFVKE